jgi:RNA polymerase sigma factor (sigma-70 family)
MIAPNNPSTGLASALARLATHRDPAALEVILREAGTGMEQLTRRLAGDAEMARDATQECLLHVRDHAGSFCPPAEGADAAARSWILRIAANAALELRRRQTRRCRHERIASRIAPAASPSPDEAFASAEITSIVRRELAELAEPTRAAIALHHLAGLGYSDVAAALGIPEGTAKTRVRRGLAELRHRLTRARVMCSLPALVGIFSDLAADESAPLLITSPAAKALLTAKATSTVALISGGLSISAKAAIAIEPILVAASIIAMNTSWVLPQNSVLPMAVTNQQRVASEKAPLAKKAQAISIKKSPADLVAAHIDTKTQEIRPVVQCMVAAISLNPEGEQDLVMLAVKNGQQVAEGTEFIIFRGNQYVVKVRVEKVLSDDMVACRVAPESWNKLEAKIQIGDLAQNWAILPSPASNEPSEPKEQPPEF